MRVEIQRQVELDGIPDDQSLRKYAEAALDQAVMDNPPEAEICVRVVDEAEGRALNLQWRGKDYATNVLSFSGSIPPGLPAGSAPQLMGDVVLCAPVVAREAQAQGKQVAHHWAHLIVHGVLHLQGFDHTEQPSASQMEQREREILADLGISDPYLESDESAA